MTSQKGESQQNTIIWAYIIIYLFVPLEPALAMLFNFVDSILSLEIKIY